MIKKKKISEAIVYIIPLAVILIFTGINLPINYYPKIFGDEYGYWAAGAWFSGLDWGNITSMNEYYGWGYGLLLSVILRLPLSAKACYVSAILLNGVMLWGIYCIAYKISLEIFPKEKKTVCCVLGMIAAFLPSSFYYTQYTISEIILGFFYWLLIYAMFILVKEYRTSTVLFVAAVDICLLSIHLRTVGIVAVSFLCVVYFGFAHNQKKKIYLIGIYALVLLIGIFGVIFIKKLYLESIALDFIQSHDKNTVVGQTRKLQSLFSLEGVISFGSNIFGRLYTVFSNTFLLAGYAILKSIIISFTKRKEEKTVSDIIAIICTINTLSMIAISSLYTICDEKYRFDILIYSRYHEFTLGILVLLGIKFLRDDFKSKKLGICIIPISFLPAILLTKIVLNCFAFDAPDTNLYINNPISFFWKMRVLNPINLFSLAIIVSIIVFGIIAVTVKRKFEFLTVIGVLIILFNVVQSNIILKEGCFSWSTSYTENAEKITDFIESKNMEDSIYFMNDDNVTNVDILQFMLKDHSVKVINYEMVDDINQTPAIVITTRDYKNNYLFESYDLVYEANRLKIWSVENE